MDTGISIVGVIIMLIMFVLPFVIVRRNRNNREKKFTQALNALAAKRGCNISENESWNDRCTIGIDKVVHVLFFIRKNENDNVEYIINLPETQACRIINTSRTIRDGKESYSVIEKLELCFEFFDKTRPQTLLVFYNAKHESLTLAGELQIAERWVQIINADIALRQIKK